MRLISSSYVSWVTSPCVTCARKTDLKYKKIHNIAKWACNAFSNMNICVEHSSLWKITVAVWSRLHVVLRSTLTELYWLYGHNMEICVEYSYPWRKKRPPSESWVVGQRVAIGKSNVTRSKKAQLTLIASPLYAFQWAQDEHRTLSLSAPKGGSKTHCRKFEQ